MPKKNLTQLAVERLQPATEAVTYWDTGLPGFGMRVSPKGRKTWIAQYRVKGGKEVLETLGTTAVIPNVREARERARASLDKARHGIHPVRERERQEAAGAVKAAANAFTFDRLVERFMAEYAYRNTKKSTSSEALRLLTRAGRAFGERPLHEIKKLDIVDLISERRPNHVKTAGLIEANNLLAIVKQTFRWALAHDLVESDPSAGILKPLAKKPTRDRVLSDDEIVAFWQGCDAIGWPFGALFKLLLLTAQRRSEVADLPWSELDLDNRVWHLPAARSKNGKAHDTHLSDLAIEVIKTMPQFEGRVFSLTGRAPVGGFNSAKKRLDQHMPAADWRLHDLRRTATTGMARLGIPPHVADKVLNHTGGVIRGVMATYNRFEYLDERKAALDAWGRFVERLVYPERAQRNVVDLRAR